VFKIPRARTGQASPDWRQEVLKNRSKIEGLLKSLSPLDSVIGPAAILALLSNLEQAAPPKKNLKLAIRQIVGPAATRLLRSFVRPETPRFQSSEPILRRLLVLREFLGNEWTVQ
jgi:hypothetical protein